MSASLDGENADGALLSVPERVIYERELARDIGDEFKDHPPPPAATPNVWTPWIAFPGGAPKYTVSNCSPTT